MRLLLDTHALIWWWTDDGRLPSGARKVIADPENVVMVSAASAWEIATKSRLGKWPQVDAMIEDFAGLLRRSRFAELPITVAHVRLAGALDGDHRDPFDRMLAAQCWIERTPIVTADEVFREFAVPVIWKRASVRS